MSVLFHVFCNDKNIKSSVSFVSRVNGAIDIYAVSGFIAIMDDPGDGASGEWTVFWGSLRSLIIIIMVIFKCYFSGELIALSYKKKKKRRCGH